jgi:hypothetical protein
MGLPVLPTHRDTDDRICGANTTVVNQDDVFANLLLVASDGDTCTDGAGQLNANADEVYVHNILVVGHIASAAPDGLCPVLGLAHCGPDTNEGSPNVFVGS